jgi:hypothetical protein
MKRNRPVLWYDKKGAPRSEPFKLTLSQIGRDILEVNRRETGASEVETRRLEILGNAMGTKECRSALAVAWRIKHNDLAALNYVLSKAADKRRFLRKVVDALDTIEGKGKPYFERPTPTALNIVESYYAAVDQLHQVHFGNGEGIYSPKEFTDDPTIPTLAEVKEQFVQLFGDQLLPADWTIRKTLKRLKVPLREGARGRPRKIASRKRA